MGQEFADQEIEDMFDDAADIKRNNEMYFNQLNGFYE